MSRLRDTHRIPISDMVTHKANARPNTISNATILAHSIADTLSKMDHDRLHVLDMLETFGNLFEIFGIVRSEEYTCCVLSLGNNIYIEAGTKKVLS